MNIYDISEKAGVSIATVSRVLNGSANVSEKTRKKVLDVMEKYEYTPNAFARGLGLNTMKTIGLLCTDSSDIYQAKAIYHIEKQLHEQGYDSILCCSGYELEAKKKCMNLLLSKKVDAVILIGSSFVYDREEDNRYIAEAGLSVPVMLLNATLDAPGVYGVLTDDENSVYEAVERLASQGISDILYFYNSDSYSGKKKLAGYLKAVETLGLCRDERLCRFFGKSHEDIPGMADHLLHLKEEGLSFHGIVTSDDELALGAVKYAKRAGLRIPEELSIIGYNNSMLALCSDPEITSVDIRLEKLCSHLTESLMHALDGEELPKKAVFSGRLVMRGTTREDKSNPIEGADK